MFLKFSLEKNGIFAKNKKINVKLKYPGEIFEKYPCKKPLLDNLAQLLTISMPFVSGIKKIEYNTAKPLFQKEFRKMILGSLPSTVECYKNENISKQTKQFNETKYVFSENKIKIPKYGGFLGERAIVSFSCGKDSLLSLAVCQELGLNPVATYINDTVSPEENKMKIINTKKIAKESGVGYEIITNEFEKLNDFETWGGTEETCLGYMHMMTGFCMIALPVMDWYKARYVVLGNQQDMNFKFKCKDGFYCYPSYDQHTGWTKIQTKMLRKFTANQGHAMSVIEPLTNISIMKILLGRYFKIGKHIVSCDDFDVSGGKRWCQNCSKCARLSLFTKANGNEPKKIGLKMMLDKKHWTHYNLFQRKDADNYERSKESIEQQLLAFYLAYRNGARGYMIDLFKKQYLAEAIKKEDYLHKKFFKIYNPGTVPPVLKKELIKIYKEELN